MQNKSFDFVATAGGYFYIVIVATLLQFIPIIGTVIAFNMMYSWLAENSIVGGRRVVYKAGFGETLKFLLVNLLLVLVTFGIYIFWFVPKTFKYVAAHVTFADEAQATATVQTPVQNPVQ